MVGKRGGRHFSIRTKIIATVTGSLILAQFVSMFLIRTLVNAQIVTQKIAVADILTTSILHDIKYTVRGDDLQGSAIIIGKYMTYYRDIIGMTIYDTAGHIVATEGQTPPRARADDDELAAARSYARPSLHAIRSSAGDLEIRSVAPILRGSRMIGALDLDISVRDVRAMMATIDRRISTIMMITLALVSGALFVLLQRSILLPLRQLIEVTQTIAAGHYDTHVDDSQKDEIGALGAAFNTMTNDLNASKRKIEDYHRGLEQSVQEATAASVSAYEDLKNAQSQLVLSEKMASLGVLIAGIAHEINTPVGAILNVSRSLEKSVRRLPEELSWLQSESGVRSETVQEFLNELVRSASQSREASSYREVRALEALLEEKGIENHRAVASTLARFNFTSPEIVDRFTDCLRLPMFLSLAESLASIVEAATISEVSSQKIREIVRALKYYAYSDNERMDQIQINESIQTALILLRSHLKQAAEVITDYDQDLPNIVCSSDIHQVWTNLLSNAIDAAAHAEGGQRGQIKVATRQSGEFVEVAITDNGTGIPLAIILKIFDPFFTTKDFGKGTGLGLAVVAGIVKKHGGTIAVESCPGNTTFTVRLPIIGVRAEAA